MRQSVFSLLIIFLYGIILSSCAEDVSNISTPDPIEAIIAAVGKGSNILSVKEYYGKTTTKSSEQQPKAYVVNFEEDGGYVVIGVRGEQTAIIAVGDSGAIDPDTLNPLSDGSDTTGNGNSTVGGLIRDGVDNFGMIDDDHGDDGYNNPGEQTPIGTIGDNGSIGSGFTPEIVVTNQPLLRTKWGQGVYGTVGGVYNKYCTDPNRAASVLAGCAVTAFAQVVAYNKIPRLTVNGINLNYDCMTSMKKANSLDSASKEQVNLLFGVLFHNTPHLLLFEEGTAITCRNLINTMESFGYTNVATLTSSGSFNHRMQELTLASLHGGRPVIMESYGWDEDNFPYVGGHYWVIDGCKDIMCTRVFHFNFGWDGLCDGWFNPLCLNPAEGLQYDNTTLSNTSSSNYCEYDFPFTRIITYSLPASNPTLNYSL